MTDPERTILTNPLPKNVPDLSFPHPVRAIKNVVAGRTAKGSFGVAGDSVAFSLRSSPAISRIRVEYIHPQEVDVFEDGKAIPVSRQEDALFARPWNTPSQRVSAIGVEKFAAIFTADGKILGTPRFEHHLQSTAFNGGLIRDHTKGVRAGKFHGVDILEGLERFGIDFLESIDDAGLKAIAATNLVEVRDMLSNPRKHFGSEAAQPHLDPDSMRAGAEFSDYIARLSLEGPAIRLAEGHGLS